MLRSQIQVDLPSEEIAHKKSLSVWLAASAAVESHDELTISCLQVVEAIMVCFAKAGIDNAIALVVDNQPIFVDKDGEDHDASKLRRAAARHGESTENFEELRLAMETHRDGLHIVFEITVHSSVKVGEKELRISLAGRPDAVIHSEGDSALAYAKKLIAFAHDDGLARATKVMEQVASEVAHQFQVQMGIYSVSQHPVEAILIRPSRDAVKSFGTLSFVPAEELRYRAMPSDEHTDLHSRYFSDALYEYQNYILIAQVIMQDAWQDRTLKILDHDGAPWVHSNTITPTHRANWATEPELQFGDNDQLIIVVGR